MIKEGISVKGYIVKITKGKYSNVDAVENVINYIYKGAKNELPPGERIYGAIGCGSTRKKEVIDAFKKIKKVYKKMDGLQLKHIVVSFGRKPDVSVKIIRRAVEDIVRFFANGEIPEGNFLVAYGVHYNKAENYHLHICVSSVSNKGKRLNIKGKVLKRFKDYVDKIWKKVLLKENPFCEF